MKRLAKRTFTAVIACMMACLMFVTPVFAAASYITKGPIKLNAVNGGQSNISSFTSGSVPDDTSVTSVKVSCNVASGTDPYTLYIKSPSGTTISIPGPTKSGSVIITEYEGENLYGTWSIWIQNDGISSNENIYPVSTVIIGFSIYFSY